MSSVWKIIGFICPVNTKVCAHTPEIPVIKPVEKTDKLLVGGKGIQRLWIWTPPALQAPLLSHGKSEEKAILRARLLCNGLGYISTAREKPGESK